MSTNSVGSNVGSNLKRSAEKLVSEKLASAKLAQAKFTPAILAPKNLKPLIKEIPNRIVERADQVLLGLSHTKQSIPTLFKQTLQRIESNPNDLVGRVGRNVLERAESVRKQLIEKAEDSEALLNKRWVPDWLKDVSFVANSAATPGEEAPLAATSDASSDSAPTETQLELDLEAKSEASATEIAAAPVKAKKPKAAKSAAVKSAKKPAAKKARAKKA